MANSTTRPYRASVCTVTPYDEAGRLDEPAVVDLVERIASQGVGLAVGTASPGEGFALSLDETERFYGLVVQTAAGRVPVCQGFLCSEGNIAPVACGDLQAAVRAGDVDAMRTAYRAVNGVFSLNIWPGGTVRFLKTAMALLGLPGAHTRPPFAALEPDKVEIVRASMRALDLPEWRGRLD